MKNYLPIGSIVVLNGGTKRVMIIGRVQGNGADDKVYDYSACLYPEGYMNSDSLYLFNNEDIARVYYLGMQDSEEFAFRDIIDKERAKLDQQ